MNDPQILDELVAFSKELADASAEFIRLHFRSDYTVETKSDTTPVTIADRGAEEIMRELILKRYPEHGVLGEEFVVDNPDAEYQWVLDPIDGTKNFVAGSTHFGTLIALTKRDLAGQDLAGPVSDTMQPVLGVINQPITRDFLVGTGERAWLNDRPVRVRPCERIEDALLLTTSPFTYARYHDAGAYEALTHRAMRYRTWGDCHGYFLIAIGGADIMADPIVNYWDIAALLPIVTGAGGTLTDWNGNDLMVTRGDKGAIATGGSIHADVIAALNP